METMKVLNFYPYYRDLLDRRVKTTTLRLPSALTYEPGESVMLTAGWPADENSRNCIRQPSNALIKNAFVT